MTSIRRRHRPRQSLPNSGTFELRANKLAAAAGTATTGFSAGLFGLSRFYRTLAAQERAIEDDDDRVALAERDDQKQEDAWLNEGGKEPA